MSELNGNRLFADLLMPQQDKTVSAAVFADVVALCPLSASSVYSDLQVAAQRLWQGKGREESRQ